ncbi:MAG: nucleoside deaminase [Crocinitomicaceae bacterium]|nr:nucleoside deaminase [Crocinitomicaceae bacterium]
MLKEQTDEFWMQKAFEEAEKALDKDEVPVGAIVVFKEQIIGRGHNMTETFNDVTAHAEIQAITAASNTLGSKFLDGCKVYITLEPCSMCAGALYWARPAKIVFGAKDEKRGAGRFEGIYHPKTEIVSGILENECAQILKNFFLKRR